MVNYACAFSQSESGKYFEWIINVFIIETPMKYQDFSSDETLVSSEDTIFILHMWRYHGRYSYISLSQWEKSITASRHWCLCNKQNITCPLVDTNFTFECSTRYLTRSLHSLMIYRVKHSKINQLFISTRGHVIFSIYYIDTDEIPGFY